MTDIIGTILERLAVLEGAVLGHKQGRVRLSIRAPHRQTRGCDPGGPLNTPDRALGGRGLFPASR